MKGRCGLPSHLLSFPFTHQETPPAPPEDPADSHSLCQSSVSLDHCYLSLSENSKAPSGSSSSWEGSEAELVWRRQEVRAGQPAARWVPHLLWALTSPTPTQDAQANPKGPPSSSDEDGDYTWTPTRRAASLPAAGRKVRKGPAKPKENKKASCPTQTKKKCVNGFIMFCRMNRKQYIRWVGVPLGPGWGPTFTVTATTPTKSSVPCCLTH